MITGTFLDEISHDIPSANWDREAWTRDFAAMRAFGIDTVVLIRAGYQDRCTFDSAVLRGRYGYLIVQQDLVALFLELCEQFGLKFFFGTYDSGRHWTAGEHQAEIDVNLAFTEEFFARYGQSPALAGWYISHEIDAFDDGVMRVYESLARHLRGLKRVPILISPYIRGAKQFGSTISLEQHEHEWDRVFARIEGLVDIVAFQDGQVEYAKLPDFLALNAGLARKHGLVSWSNVESFDRDVHIKFPPIAWPKLRYKMDAARSAGVDKLITFEFSHFLSPNSMFPSAKGLHALYMQWKRELESRNA